MEPNYRVLYEVIRFGARTPTSLVYWQAALWACRFSN